MNREIEAHLALEARERQGEGLTEMEARDAARAFGNTALAMEDARAAHGGAWWEARWADLRYGVRLLRRQPGLSLAAAVGLLIVVSLAAATGPSRRAVSTNAAEVLRG